jgi:hypothetical protein
MPCWATLKGRQLSSSSGNIADIQIIIRLVLGDAHRRLGKEKRNRHIVGRGEVAEAIARHAANAALVFLHLLKSNFQLCHARYGAF